MIDGRTTCHMEMVDCSPRGDVSLLFSVSVSCSYKHTNSQTQEYLHAFPRAKRRHAASDVESLGTSSLRGEANLTTTHRPTFSFCPCLFEAQDWNNCPSPSFGV